MQILDAYKGKVRALSFSADGAYLAVTGSTGYSISLWSLAMVQRVRVMVLTAYQPFEVACAPRGTALVACNRAEVWLWDDLLNTDHTARRYHGIAAAFRGDGQALAYLTDDSDDSSVCFLDWLSGVPVRPAVPVSSWLDRLVWSPTGEHLALFDARTTASRPTISLLRMNDGEVRDIVSEQKALHGMAFSPCGKCLTLAAGDIIPRWDVATAQPRTPLKGHARVVNAVAYLPDGRLLSCGNDGTVRTWVDDRCVDVKDWQLGPLTALTVAPDGMRAAVGTKSGTILIWDVD
jgi:WD40 repeat protein